MDLAKSEPIKHPKHDSSPQVSTYHITNHKYTMHFSVNVGMSRICKCPSMLSPLTRILVGTYQKTNPLKTNENMYEFGG